MPNRVAPETTAALRRTAQRYTVCGRFTRHYVASKLRMDPVHAAILQLEQPFGTVIDLGSGRGQMGVVLLEAGLATSVLAVDQDAEALAELRHAAAGLSLHTQTADLATWQPGGAADTILLIDVLYQFTTETQLALLRTAAQHASRAVIIRASDPQRGWRSALSAVLERIGRHWWPTFGSRSNPLPPMLLAQVLAECGYTVSTAPCAEGTPLAGMLLVGRRLGSA